MRDGTYVHHCGILFTALHKLTVRDLGILVFIHAPEYLFHPLDSEINA
jgi:hypothetical protein